MMEIHQVPGVLWAALVALGGGIIYIASITLQLREKILTKQDADDRYIRKENALSRGDASEKYYRKDELVQLFVTQEQMRTLTGARDKQCEAHKEAMMQIRETSLQRAEATHKLAEAERSAVQIARNEMQLAVMSHEKKDGHDGSLAAISEIKTDLAVITTTQEQHGKTLDHHGQLLEAIHREVKNNGNGHGAAK